MCSTLIDKAATNSWQAEIRKSHQGNASNEENQHEDLQEAYRQD
jgi:hypothetical protein